MEWIVVGLAALGLVALIVYVARKERAAKQVRAHGPQTPGAGYDPEAMARSKRAGEALSSGLSNG